MYIFCIMVMYTFLYSSTLFCTVHCILTLLWIYGTFDRERSFILHGFYVCCEMLGFARSTERRIWGVQAASAQPPTYSLMLLLQSHRSKLCWKCVENRKRLLHRRPSSLLLFSTILLSSRHSFATAYVTCLRKKNLVWNLREHSHTSVIL